MQRVESSDGCCPQGSVLGLALFSNLVRDTDNGIGRTLGKFTDSTELWDTVRLQGSDSIQRSLGRLGRWVWLNLMKFNKASAGSCMRAIPSTNTVWTANELRAAVQRKT